MRKMLNASLVVLVLLSIFASACAPAATQAPPTAAAVAPTQPAKVWKLAALFPGVITDADYNTLGYLGLTEVKGSLGVETAYSESVPVPDIDRAMREYIDQGYNIIWTHGSQFLNQTIDLAKQMPDVVFIAEGDSEVQDPPANLWVIDRNFHVGYYAIGAIAAKATKTGKIGYIGGATLPFSYAEVHAVQQAIKDLGLNVEFKTAWTGDFNDPTKGRQFADAMISDGVDVIICSLNLGIFGVFEAAKAKGDSILVTAKYIDKTNFAPKNYITSLLYDFKGPMTDIVKQIKDGKQGGYYPLGFATGVDVQMPLLNVSPDLQPQIESIVNDVKSGKIQVVKNTDKVQEKTMPSETILEMKGFTKSFGNNLALKDVNFALAAREIHGLLGGNGAGKTTLMNILYGLYRADAGEIVLHGEQVEITSPKAAIRNRIGMVHQQFLQVKSFTVLENVVIGTPIQRRFNLNLAEEERKVRDLCERFSLEIDPQARIEDLSMGARQKVEILKALYRGTEILILDEPTTNLTPQEVDALFQSLRVMVDDGLSIVFITHKLREVLAVCDRISVLRNGQNVLTLQREESTEEAFVRAMVGDEIDIQQSVVFSQKGMESLIAASSANVVLQVEKVTRLNEEDRPLIKDIDFEICEGEILGVAGVAANGQRELCETIIGVQPASKGTVCFAGREITHAATSDLLASGMAYIPEDCLRDGYLPKANVAQNLILGYQQQAPYSKNRFMNWDVIFNRVRDLISEYHVKTLGPSETGANLSGGNIQRVVVARAFSRPCKLLVAHNPTRGLDIPSIDFFYNRLLERKQQGMATLLISENLDELLLLCNRIAVLYRGEFVGVLTRDQFEKYEIGRMMSGVRAN